ncbi:MULTISPECIES: hypothetical protein [Burkholderia]|uniref:hypothetical protein n=1 Tax=Burkholderia TaxID=32008 RepID=UPI001ABAA21B
MPAAGFSENFLQNLDVQRLLCHQPLELLIFLFQLPQSSCFGDIHAAVATTPVNGMDCSGRRIVTAGVPVHRSIVMDTVRFLAIDLAKNVFQLDVATTFTPLI